MVVTVWLVNPSLSVSAAVVFRKKWEIALAEVERLPAAGLSCAPVVADGGYGMATEFRDGLTARGLSYAVGISGEVTVWPPGTQPAAPKRGCGRGRPPKLLRRTTGHKPPSAAALARALPASAWKQARRREGTKGRMQPRSARLRIRVAHRDYWGSEPRAPEWLLIEWPRGQCEPSKCWLLERTGNGVTGGLGRAGQDAPADRAGLRGAEG